MTAALRADALRRQTFALLGEFKDFAAAVADAPGRSAAKREAASQADAVACALASVYDRMSGPDAEWDLFTDAARDRPEYTTHLDGIAEDFPATLAAMIAAAGHATPAAFAAASGIAPQTVHNLLAGHRRPGWDTVQRLATALNVPTDAFRDRPAPE